MPFSIKGLDSDNDNVLINAHMLRYCEGKGITFARSGFGNKNDCCYVEQKNWSVVRRIVGYARYDMDDEVEILNEIYDRDIRCLEVIRELLPTYGKADAQRKAWSQGKEALRHS